MRDCGFFFFLFQITLEQIQTEIRPNFPNISHLAHTLFKCIAAPPPPNSHPLPTIERGFEQLAMYSVTRLLYKGSCGYGVAALKGVVTNNGEGGRGAKNGRGGGQLQLYPYKRK